MFKIVQTTNRQKGIPHGQLVDADHHLMKFNIHLSWKQRRNSKGPPSCEISAYGEINKEINPTAERRFNHRAFKDFLGDFREEEPRNLEQAQTKKC